MASLSPKLSDPPADAVNALAAACKSGSASTCGWLVDLDRFYQKQDAVKAGN